MKDLIYVAATIGFFGLMVGYVAACARLGRTHQVKEGDHDAR